MRNLLIVVYGLTLAFAASAVEAASTKGRFLVISDTETVGGYAVVDAAHIKRTGDLARVSYYTAFRQPLTENLIVAVRYDQEYDCRARKSRPLSVAHLNTGLRVVQTDRMIQDWRAPGAGSPGDRILTVVCDGAALPEAGVDLKVVFRAYWDRTRAARESQQ